MTDITTLKNEIEETWQIQDIFHAKMKVDFEKGVITNPIYRPYFNWKFYGGDINLLTKEVCFHIMKTAQAELDLLDEKYPEGHKMLLKIATLGNVWNAYEGYGEDRYLYSYLIAIENEATKIMMR